MIIPRRKAATQRCLAIAVAAIGTIIGLSYWMPGNLAADDLLRPSLPVVPQQQPRPQEGPAPNEKWQVQRPDHDKAAVASFIESIQGSDSAIQVTIGQGRLLTLRKPVVDKNGASLIAVGDPSVVDFEVLPNPRLIRLIGRRAGVSDLSIITADGVAHTFEIHVGYDLSLVTAQLQQVFPTAKLKVGQIREHLVVEGQARSTDQVAQIVKTLEAYLESVLVPINIRGQQNTGGVANRRFPSPRESPQNPDDPNAAGQMRTLGEEVPRPEVQATYASPQVINLIHIPGVHQVMLQVQIAELNRTAMREVGADLGYAKNGKVIGTGVGGALVTALGLLGPGVTGGASVANSSSTTAFGIFPKSDFQFFLTALRRNALLNILAEPNLVALSGQEASFLAGGQFPVPVPQGTGLGNTVTVQYKDFGVQLNFLPFVMDDDVIRLTVTPEVSSIDFALGTTLVPGGDPIPGLNSRRTSTTVELRQGQTLAIAGLLQTEVNGSTSRIPGLGDLPYIGSVFSNTNHERREKELIVMVTPYLVSPSTAPLGPLPGEEIQDPTDWEFYLHNRIEGRTGLHFRSTTAWDDPHLRLLHLEKDVVNGPFGFSKLDD